jgi:hypothetical protein
MSLHLLRSAVSKFISYDNSFVVLPMFVLKHHNYRFVCCYGRTLCCVSAVLDLTGGLVG